MDVEFHMQGGHNLYINNYDGSKKGIKDGLKVQFLVFENQNIIINTSKICYIKFVDKEK